MASGSGTKFRTRMTGARAARGRETRDYVREIRRAYRAGEMTRAEMQRELAYVRDYRRNG